MLFPNPITSNNLKSNFTLSEESGKLCLEGSLIVINRCLVFQVSQLTLPGFVSLPPCNNTLSHIRRSQERVC